MRHQLSSTSVTRILTSLMHTVEAFGHSQDPVLQQAAKEAKTAQTEFLQVVSASR